MPTQNVIDNEIMITEPARFKSHDKLRLAGEMLATAAKISKMRRRTSTISSAYS